MLRFKVVSIFQLLRIKIARKWAFSKVGDGEILVQCGTKELKRLRDPHHKAREQQRVINKYKAYQ